MAQYRVQIAVEPHQWEVTDHRLPGAAGVVAIGRKQDKDSLATVSVCATGSSWLRTFMRRCRSDTPAEDDALALTW